MSTVTASFNTAARQMTELSRDQIVPAKTNRNVSAKKTQLQILLTTYYLVWSRRCRWTNFSRLRSGNTSVRRFICKNGTHTN